MPGENISHRWNIGWVGHQHWCPLHKYWGTCPRVPWGSTRDGNRTEPKPNTPNSNTILRPFRTERTQRFWQPNPNRTEPSGWTNRTELELFTVGSIPTVITIDLSGWANCYAETDSGEYTGVIGFTCNRTRPKIVKCACELGIPNRWSVELEPNPNYNSDRTELNPNLHCSVRFPSLGSTYMSVCLFVL